VDIDMLAGPSEILIIADSTANPVYVAADMLSQAEHDEKSAAILVTDSEELAGSVTEEIERQLKTLPREKIARACLESNGMIVFVGGMEEEIKICNDIAPDHLEICTKDPFSLLNGVRHAGSIFLGNNAPEALGDYLAGTNHILPTNGTARFNGPLGVDDFTKKSSFIYYTKDALMEVRDRIVEFAEREELAAHGRSVEIRFEDEK
jgi:histidinol dehydrogenase